MYLLFQCQSCNHKFSTLDEMEVICPECNSSKVKVLWERGASKQDYEDLKKLMDEE